MNTIVYYDLETAGLEINQPIIQIGAVASRNGHIIDTYEAKIQFDVSMADPEALSKNCYNETAWLEAKESEDVVIEFASFLSKHATLDMVSKKGRAYKVAQLAGYNVQGFDQPRLIKFFSDRSVFMPAYYLGLDVLQLVMWYSYLSGVKFDSYKLEVVCEKFGVPLNNAHDAIEDITATAHLAEIIKAYCNVGQPLGV